MSDNSTGSSGSSNNSWTLLSPEEAAIDIAGPVDDGTESIGDVPSLAEEVAGSSFDVKPSDSEAPQETVLSEEGYQVCQETTPEVFFAEGAASGPSAEPDPEICAPVIHATITTSPPDNDLLGAVPFSIATESSLFLSQEPFLEAYYEEACLVPEAEAEETPEFADDNGTASKPIAETGPPSAPVAGTGPDAAPVAETGPDAAPVAETGPDAAPVAEIGPIVEPTDVTAPPSEPFAENLPVPEPIQEIIPSSEPAAETFPFPKPIDEIGPASEPESEISPSPEPPQSPFLDIAADVTDITRTSALPVLDICPEDISYPRLSPEITPSPAAEGPYPETPASSVLEEKDLEHESVYVARQAEPVDEPTERGGEEVGLRRRRPEEPRRSSDEEDVEDMEFRLPERKEEKPGWSLSHLIIGALALLCLGAFLISGTVIDQAGDDFDGSELSDQELLEKLVEENKQISILEAQIQAQKEELDRAFTAAAEKGITDKEHARMVEELSALPGLKEELQSLKARVSELTRLTGEEPSKASPLSSEEGQSPTGPERLWGKSAELQRQKLLLEQSKTRLEALTKRDWPKKGFGERLVEMQQRLSDQVDRISKRDERRRKHKGAESREKPKESLETFSDGWELKKAARKVERERRKNQRSSEAERDRSARRHFELKDFWKLQEKKMRKRQDPPGGCQGVSGCAEAEGLVHVKLSEFRGLLDAYLNKLRGLGAENKEAFHRLVAQVFRDGVFRHDKMLFGEFAEDVADILEDLADLLIDDDALEEEMEEFEREVLWHFAA